LTPKDEPYSYPIIDVIVVSGIKMDLPLVTIDVPYGFDEVRVGHGRGGTVAVDLEQLHRAHSLGEVGGAAMFHGEGFKGIWFPLGSGVGWRR
jgi:hypothetical protein